MTRIGFARAGRFFVALIALALLLSACGGKRKRYIDQITIFMTKNEEIDSRVAKLPRVNAYKYPDYLPKLDSYIAGKQTLLSQIELIEPPFLLSTTHNKLIIAMKNGIRYLQSEREKFIIAAEKIKSVPEWQGSAHGREEYDIIKQYYSQTSAYQADIKEQMMKQQYERLYDEVREELGRAAKF
jgi:hypothetical protein